MYIKNLTLLLITIFMALMLASLAFAGHPGKPVTPYGDFCDQCTKYGTCKTILTHEAAKKAMFDYYHKKGLRVELVKKKGRFIRAVVKEKGKGKSKVVDVIIFDRRTGRIEIYILMRQGRGQRREVMGYSIEKDKNIKLLRGDVDGERE